MVQCRSDEIAGKSPRAVILPILRDCSGYEAGQMPRSQPSPEQPFLRNLLERKLTGIAHGVASTIAKAMLVRNVDCVSALHPGDCTGLNCFLNQLIR